MVTFGIHALLEEKTGVEIIVPLNLSEESLPKLHSGGSDYVIPLRLASIVLFTLPGADGQVIKKSALFAER
jgi:hypothetical protein